MLVLSRRVGEKVVIGDDVFVTICDIKSNQIRLGINAPIATAIHREEIYKKIQLEKMKSVTKLSGKA